jgi:excisionase family DNA binding protein
MSDKPVPHTALMTVEQVSDYLQVSRRTVYDLRKANAIPFVRIGGQFRFRRAEIDAWINERTIKAVR